MKTLYISDHALVRYCERVLGLDKLAVIKSISAALGPVKDGKHKLPDVDIVAVIENNTIKTFIPYYPNPNFKKRIQKTNPIGKYVRTSNNTVFDDPEFFMWPEEKVINVDIVAPHDQYT